MMPEPGAKMDSAVWQISAGPANRCYTDVFLRYGVALLGPGDAGVWAASRPDDDFEGPNVRRFATELRVGDALLLRTGPSRIGAVGIVASEYQYLEQCDDINGLDLQHARRVRWFALPDAYDFGTAVFGAKPPRISRVLEGAPLGIVLKYLNGPPDRWKRAPLPPLPVEDPALEHIPDYLQDLVGMARDLVPLYLDKRNCDALPTEDELVAHFVIPLLRSLGWPPELVAIKWRRVDVTLFNCLPRMPENCAFIIEAKRLGAGVEGALQQAQDYLSDLGVRRNILVTDGIRYRLYGCDKAYSSVAYANLIRLKEPALRLFEAIRRR